jgi:hypothetical protein
MQGVSSMDTTANPSGAPVAGGATTAASKFGGLSLKARFWKLVANLGRRMTGMAYRNLRDMDGDGERMGPAGQPSRTAGAPPPSDLTPPQ